MILLVISQMGCNKALYQVFDVKSADPKLDAASMVYNAGDVKVSYDFWSEGGIVSFRVQNATTKPIYIDWDRSHFILNGLSREYYGDLSSNVSVATVNNNSKGGLLSYGKFKFSASTSRQFGLRTKKIVEIPAGASVTVADFNVSENIVADCELKIPLLKKTAAKEYTAENSPLIFRNYLTYYSSRAETEGEGTIIDNSFYVANITSMKMKEFNGDLVSAKEACTICPGTKKVKMMSYSFPYTSKGRFFASCGKLKIK
jgi:hypothetical protein